MRLLVLLFFFGMVGCGKKDSLSGNIATQSLNQSSNQPPDNNSLPPVDTSDPDPMVPVIPNLKIENANRDVFAGEQLTVQVSGGSPPYTFSVVSGGGTIVADGTYTAPSVSSRPVVRVTDSQNKTVELKLRSLSLHYLGGGTVNFVTHSNVWSSHDGISWISQKNLISPLQGFSLSILDDVIYLLGGWNGAGQVTSYRTNNVNDWVQGGNFSRTMEMSSSVVHNGKIYIAGNGEFFSTTDGNSFKRETLLPVVRHGARLEYFNGKFFLMGGADPSNAIYDHVFSSTDGITWTEVGRLPVRRYAGATTVFNGRMYYIGGTGGSGSLMNEVFSTSDGINWVQEPSLPEGRNYLRAAVYKGRIWIVGGYNATTEVATVYSSRDGKTWDLTGSLPAARYNGFLTVY